MRNEMRVLRCIRIATVERAEILKQVSCLISKRCPKGWCIENVDKAGRQGDIFVMKIWSLTLLYGKMTKSALQALDQSGKGSILN